jgi:cytochrome c
MKEKKAKIFFLKFKEKKMKKLVLSTIVVAATAASLSAASLAACAGCHGATFEKAAMGKSQVVKGWDAAKIETALKGYKDGTYGGAMKGLMAGQVKALSDADMKDMATQIAAMK